MTTTTTKILSSILSWYRAHGLGVRVTSTDRTIAQQNELYRAGRTRLPGGRSLHNYGRAFDLVPGTPWPTNVDRSTSFKHLAAVGRMFGLEAVVERDHVHFEH